MGHPIPSTYRLECSIVRFGISSSSVRHQFVISSSSARRQLVISSSSAHHQFVISSSSEKKGKRETEKEKKRKREKEKKRRRGKEKKRKREKEKKEKKTDSRNGLGRAPTYNRKILRRVSTQLDNLSICHQSIHLSYHL